MPVLKKILLILTMLLYITTNAQSIRINEFSQGANGSKEWVELLVTTTSPIGLTNCSSIRLNIAGWIMDDNNGDFSPPNHFTGSGIAAGHMRFKNQAPWTSLPSGAIIVIYNSVDKDIVTNFPADDPTDINGDCVYVLPSSHPSLEYCTTLPVATSCTLRTDYSGCTYGLGGWTNISLADAGDAIQIRDPFFNLVHGLVYGRSSSTCTGTNPMVGNTLAPLISTANMGGNSAYFNGTKLSDFYDPTKWVIQNASLATPGWANSLNDSLYIKDSIRGGCTCSQVLPLIDNMSYLPYSQPNSEVRLVNGILITKNNRFNKIVSVYDAIGRLVYQISSSQSNIDLSHYLKYGYYFIKVYIDGFPPKSYTFKIKN